MNELWEQAEVWACKFFNMRLTSGSGRGHDKGDGKDPDWMMEVKSYSNKSYGLNYEKFREWRLNASNSDKNFFMVTIPVIDGQLSPKDAIVSLEARLWQSILNEQTNSLTN